MIKTQKGWAQFNMLMPPSFIKTARRRANKEGVSLGQKIRDLIEEWLKATQPSK